MGPSLGRPGPSLIWKAQAQLWKKGLSIGLPEPEGPRPRPARAWLFQARPNTSIDDVLHFAIAADNETIVFVLISLVILYNLQTIDAKMKKIFILLICHHLAMAQIDQHFMVD